MRTLEDIMTGSGGSVATQALPPLQEVSGGRSLDQIFQQSNSPTPTVPISRGRNTPLQAGVESALNVPRSFINFVKGGIELITNPVDTAKGLFSVTRGFGERVGREILERIPATAERVRQTPEAKDEQAFNALAQGLKERYGSLDALERTATEDPFGFGIDILTAITGGAALAGRAGLVARGIETVGGGATRAGTRAVTGVGQRVGRTAEFGVTQATGLSRPTLETIFRRGDDLKLAQKTGLSRQTLGQEVGTRVKTRLSEMSDLGKGYETIRQSSSVVELQPNFVGEILKSKGFNIVDGKIKPTRTAPTRASADINALQNLYDNWGGATKLTADEFLNFRGDLAELAKFDRVSGKTRASESIAKELRAKLNEKGRSQVEGLEALDAEFKVERDLLTQVRKDWLDRDGTLKDVAYSKIANLTQPNRVKVLQRLEKVIPGIRDQVEIVRALEDIERARGLKVGTYARGVIGGGAILTGNIPALIATILTQPEFAVPLIRGLGIANNQIRPILNVVFRMMKDINNLTISGSALRLKIQEYIDNPKLGLSIEDVSKNRQPNRLGQGAETGLSRSLVDDTIDSSLLQEARIKSFSPNSASPTQQNDLVKAAKIGEGKYDVGQVYVQEVMGKERPIIISKVNPDGSVEGFYMGAVSPTERSFGIGIDSLQPAKWNRPNTELRTPSFDQQTLDLFKSRVFEKQPQALKLDDSLAQEARKYKSAEEFVKGQELVYHGSPTPLKRFSDKKGGVFFTNEYADATGFAGTPDNVYEGYLNFKKPLVIDAKGAKWDNLNTKWGRTTQEIVGNAEKAGYDGVTFKNVVDNIADDVEVGTPGTIHFAYKPSESFINKSQLTDIWERANKK